MTELKYWRDLPKSEKERLKSEHNIKVVTFEFICKMYLFKLKRDDKSRNSNLSKEN